MKPRPPGHRLLWALAFLLVGSGLGLALYPYPPLPAAEVEAARNAVQVARRDAAQLAPALVEQAAASAQVMERLYAEDRARLVRFTRLEALDRAIAETTTLAEQAGAAARAEFASRLASAGELMGQLETELKSLAPEVALLPPRERGARGAHARAGLALAQAADAQGQRQLLLMNRSLVTAQQEIEITRKLLGGHYERFNSQDWRRRWQALANETLAASRGGKLAIVVTKLDRKLYLLRDGRVAATFDADLGHNALVDKISAGDGATPEGRYHVTEKRANGRTRWYKALMLNYPNAEDLRNFAALRKNGSIPRGHGPGGLIEIHGHGGRNANWTDGCVAVTNAEMDQLFAVVPVGTPVTIVGVAKLPTGGP